MEPMDILKLKDSAASSEIPRRVVSAVKSKTQFSYFRLNEDVTEQHSRASSPTTKTNTAAPPAAPKEEPLLIDLSPDPPSLLPTTQPLLKPQPLYQPLTEQQLLNAADQNRIYANYPSPSSPEIPAPTTTQDQIYSSHYYSEVPIEPMSPPLSKNASPAKPVVNEELKKKRDEAFDWLGEALGEITLSKSSARQCITPLISGQQQLEVKPKTYGFEDNFSTATLPSSGIQQFQRQTQDQIDAARQPFYPKPGVWTDHTPTATPLFTLPGPSSRMPSVQTAHVRPFMVSNPSAPPYEDVRSCSIINQVHVSTPWASESEIKQALVIHNGNAVEAIRFLQVEKLYR